MADIGTIKRLLQDRAQEVAEHLLPRGIRDGREWCAGSTRGEAGQSLKVCIQGAKAGTWADFAEGGAGGDLIDLWCSVKGQRLTEALDDIRRWLGVEQPRFEKSERSWRRPEKPKSEAPRGAVLQYLLNERKLSAHALAAYQVGEQGRTIVLPSLVDGQLAFVKYLGVDRGPDGKKNIRVESGCEPALFGWQAIDPNARQVVITEGELDAASMYDFGYPALSVPFGGGRGAKQGRWIEAEFDRLQRFEVIFLALDMDRDGDAAAEEIANRLGRHRCRRVRLPRKDANECLKAGIAAADIARCIEEAQTLDPIELRRAGEFTDAVVNLFYPPGDLEPGYRLPFAKLHHRVIFRPAEMSIWTGPSGAGKSQLLSHACVGWGAQGARVCVASLEMVAQVLLKRMVKQAGNVDRPTGAYLRDVMDWLDGWLWIFAADGKRSMERIIEIFEYARARYGCDVFIVDSLMRTGIGTEDYDAQEKAVFALVSWTIEKHVHTHLVAHARKGSRDGHEIPEIEDVKGTSEIAANAFNILSVWRNRKLEDEVRRLSELAEHGDAAAQLKADELAERPPVILNVAKQRNGDWEGKVGLWFSRESYQYRSAADARHGQRYVEPTHTAGRPDAAA
ncbi:MAG: AAA family ATPase [Alphaproteobacteria bacterium]